MFLFFFFFFFFNDTATTEIYTTEDTLSLHDALPIPRLGRHRFDLERLLAEQDGEIVRLGRGARARQHHGGDPVGSGEHQPAEIPGHRAAVPGIDPVAAANQREPEPVAEPPARV